MSCDREDDFRVSAPPRSVAEASRAPVWLCWYCSGDQDPRADHLRSTRILPAAHQPFPSIVIARCYRCLAEETVACIRRCVSLTLALLEIDGAIGTELLHLKQCDYRVPWTPVSTYR
jgi:hypothetical protein